MKKILNQLIEHQRLTQLQAKEVLINISQGKFNPSLISAFISVYLMRSISVEELEGFRSALLELCTPVDLGGIESIDVCGTGGDGKNTFNISTTSAFVIAGAGYKVSKHGNYGVSSICGSSNVLEYLGLRFSNDVDKLKKQIEQSNICFLHAPLFHPALKSVGPIRRDLGIKTFFNILGPLVNPARPSHQLIGVFDLKVLKLYQYLLEQTSTKYTIVHSIDGYDEISLTSDAKIIQQGKEEFSGPEYFNLDKIEPSAIFGGDDIQAAAKIFTNVLSGLGTAAQTSVVCANSALAINTFKPKLDIMECYKEAEESISSGQALASFNKLISLN